MSKNDKWLYSRIFHPVGQGAFYTERHELKSETINVVYDCGSATLSKKGLRKYINSVYKKGEQIDILFISHFHADHINGIKYLMQRCDIKRVVIPLLDTETESLVKIDLH